MVSNQSIYEHDLGNEQFLNSFALDPSISQDDLVNTVTSRDGTASELDLESLANIYQLKAKAPSLEDFNITTTNKKYVVPTQFQPLREVLEVYLPIISGQFDGPIMVINDICSQNLRGCEGKWFDFKATELMAIPAKEILDANKVLYNLDSYSDKIERLLEEGKLTDEQIRNFKQITPELIGHYPTGKTIDGLLPQYGLDANQMARYFAFAFIMLPNNGDEISFVQRAKGLGIAADCMALSGATPPFHEDFLKEGFDFPGYFRKVIEGEMEEEYKLSPDEFRIGTCYLIDDKKSIPFVAIEITTTPSTKEIAERSYGDKEIIKEHPILYATSLSAVPTLIQRFPLLQSSAYVMDKVAKQIE